MLSRCVPGKDNVAAQMGVRHTRVNGGEGKRNRGPSPASVLCPVTNPCSRAPHVDQSHEHKGRSCLLRRGGSGWGH